MNVKHIRLVLRWAAGVAGIGVAAIVVALALNADGTLLLLVTLVVIAVLALWLTVEVSVANTDRVIAAMPKAHHIVAATIREYEAEAAREAGLPQIADGQRTR